MTANRSGIADVSLSAREFTSIDDLAEDFRAKRVTPPHLTSARLRDLERDPRFAARYVEVRSQGLPVLALPSYYPQTDRWPDPAYDVTARLGIEPHLTASSFCLIGGHADLRCAALEIEDVSPLLLDAAAECALRISGQVAAREGRVAAALYTDTGSRLFRAASALGATQRTILGHRYSIPDVGSGAGSYLSMLSSSKRGMVRRDLRDLARAGITARYVSWDSVVAEAAPLVAEVHNAHDAPDLPQLALMRLRRRAQDPDVTGVAFGVWHSGQLSAVTLGWVHGRTLELYEVGLAAQPSVDRSLRYLEVMFYAPLRFMWQSHLRTLDLALESGRPKKLRGAIEEPVAGFILPGPPGRPDRLLSS